MIRYANLIPGPGFQARRAALYYLQRLVTAPLPRRTISRVIAGWLRRRHGAFLAPALNEASKRALGELRREGLAILRPLLPRDAITRIAQYFLMRPLVAGMTVADLPEGVAAASYDLETILSCPGLLKLVNAPRILRIAAAYLGCKPTLSSIGVRWTFPQAETPTRFQGYHRDIDDWRFLKLFIYLSDVDEGSGPHTYIRQSHETPFGIRAKTYSHQALAKRFGEDKITSVTGPRGTTFMADTIGVHRGGSPVTRPRLMLQVQYSLLPVFAFDYAPEERESVGLDLYCNRLLFRPVRTSVQGDPERTSEACFDQSARRRPG